MKSKIILFLIAALLTVSFINLFSVEPIAYWNFDDKTCRDQIGTSHGEIVGDVLFKKGIRGYAVRVADYSTAGSYIEIPHHSGLELGGSDMSISFWFKTDQIQGQKSFRVMMKKGGTWVDSWAVRMNKKGPVHLKIAVEHQTIDYKLFLGNADKITTEWSHLAITMDRDGDAVIYINGKESQRQPFSLYKDINIINNGPLMILNNDSRTLPFNGLMDEIKIFKGLLSSEEIVKLAKNVQ